MRKSSGVPKGKSVYRHVPLGVGGQLIKLSIANDGAKVVCADIYGAYVRYPSDSKFKLLFTGAPASLIPNDHTRVGYSGGTYNDSQGCADAVLAPSDSTNVWMIVDGQLCLSTDSGNSFTATAAARSKFQSNGHDAKAWAGHMITIHHTDPSTVLFGTEGNGVFASTNKGGAFTSLSVAAGNTSPGGYPMPHFTARDPVSGKWYYSRHGFGIYQSATTSPTSAYTLMTGSPTQPTSLYCDAFGTLWGTQYGATENIYKCPTGGSWSNISTGTGQSFDAIAVDPHSSNVIVAQSGIGTYYRSRDGGATWPDRWTNNASNSPAEQFLRSTDSAKYLDTPAPQQYTIVSNQMAFDPTVAGRLWSAGWIEIAYCDLPATGSGGSNPLRWYGTGKGIEEAVVHTACVTSTGKAFAGCWDLGTYRIDDLTRYINPQVCGYQPTDTVANGHRHPTMIQPCASIDYAYDNPNYLVFLEWGGWDSDRITNPHVSVSTDGGQTLAPFAVAPPNKPFGNGGGNVAVGAAGNVIILWNCNALGTYTKDGGATWSNITIPGMAAGDNGFDFTGNGGYFLSRVGLTHDKLGYFYVFSYGSSQTPSSYGFWRSTNGDTWTKMSASAPAAFGGNFAGLIATHLRAVPGQTGYLYMTNGNGGGDFVGCLVRSTDGGATWSAALTTNSGQTITNVSDIAFGKAATAKTFPTIFLWGTVNGVTGIYRSDDNLATCVLQSSFPDGSTTVPLQLAGDMSTYGRHYLCMDGNGLIVGDYDCTMKAGA